MEPFITWLRGQGIPDDHIRAYRHYLAELAKHPSLSAAIKAAEEAGTPPQQIANLRQVAARLLEFQEAGGATVAASSSVAASPSIAASPSVASVAVSAVASLEVEPKQPRPGGASSLEVEAREPRAARASRAPAVEPRRKGCECAKRYDVYLDNDFGALASWLGGGIGIGTIIIIRFIGILGAAALALGLAGMGGLVTIFSICFRCQGCRRRITDLDEDEREHLRKGRGMVVVVTLGLLIAAAVCGYLWVLAMQSRNRGGEF